MGSYFEDVYIKRMNREGRTRQERIKTRKENEFNRIFLKQSAYQSYLYQVNDEETAEICSLQPNKWNEDNIISNLLLSTSARTLKTGDILKIRQTIKDKEVDKIWLVLFVEDNITKGYQVFKVICLDSELNFTDEYGNTQHNFPVKFVNLSSKIVQDVFIHSATQLGYREPNGNRFFITHDFDFIKKSKYFDYKGRGWEVYGIDNISILDVAFVTFSEKLKKETEPLKSQDILIGEDTNFFLNGGV